MEHELVPLTASDDGGDCGLPHEETLMFRLTEAVGSNVSSAQGWQQLEQALRIAFNAGAQPADIARVVDAYFRSGANADMPPIG